MDLGLASAVFGAAGLAGGLLGGFWAGRRSCRASTAMAPGLPSAPTPESNPPALQAQLHAELANRAKEEFLANISHEIRTPLTAILGFTDLLLRGDEDEAKRREYLTLIRNSGKHLLDLINDILDLSKMRAGKMKIRPVECSVHEVLCEVVALHRLGAEQKGLYLKYVWNGAIPERVRTDPARFRQMVTNLVGNALKFTSQGGVTLTLEMIDAKADGGKPLLAVRVTDTGIGISRDKLCEIFEPFNQADTTVTRRFGGTGLGLTITREIVQSLGGKLTVSSRPGEGSTFTASVDPGPLEGVAMLREMPAAQAGELPSPSLVGTAADLAGVRVLLVEDGDANRQLISAMLAGAGASVVTAEDGQVGVDKALAERFDLILMDMQMPVLDGFRATQQLRRQGVTVPVVALTAHALAEELDHCLEAGCSSCLSKPIEAALLISAIRGIVGRRQPATLPAGQSPDDTTRQTVDRVFSNSDGCIQSSLPSGFNDIVCQFVPQLKQLVRDLRAAFDQRELAAVRRLTHSLRGSAGTAGFHGFTEPAQRLSQAMSETDWKRAETVLAEIERMAERVVSPRGQDMSVGRPDPKRSSEGFASE